MKNLKFATKFLLVILSVSIVSLAAVMIVSYGGLLRLAKYSQEVNSELGLYVSENSKAALIEQAEAYLSRLSQVKANKCNETLSQIQNDVVVMAGYLEDIYENPGSFQGKMLPLPHEASADVPEATIMIPEDMEITAEIEKEMLLISNAEYLDITMLCCKFL